MPIVVTKPTNIPRSYRGVNRIAKLHAHRHADAAGRRIRSLSDDFGADPSWKLLRVTKQCQEGLRERLATVRREIKFHEFVEWWKRDTQHLSNIKKIICHPAYFRIVGMGNEALPLILDELQRELDYWFVALTAITGHEPCTDRKQVAMDDMRAAWLNWGREHGYLRARDSQRS